MIDLLGLGVVVVTVVYAVVAIVTDSDEPFDPNDGDGFA